MHKPTEEVRRLFDKKVFEKSMMNKAAQKTNNNNQGAVTSRKTLGKEME